MDSDNPVEQEVGETAREGASAVGVGAQKAQVILGEAWNQLKQQVLKRALQSLLAAASPYLTVPVVILTGVLLIIFILVFAVGAGTAGELTGVNNPRESGGPVQCEPGEPCPIEPPPATGECAELANVPRLSYSYQNDRVGIPQGQIERVVGDPPEDPVGEMVTVHPRICDGLIGMVNSGITIRVTAALNRHDKYVAGSNRISAHWVGAAVDFGNNVAIARYMFENRSALGIDQIITGVWRQYNVNNGQPYDGYSEALLQSHMNHIHVGW